MKWVDKKYEIIRSLGGGAFSDVYLVKGPEGRVALKLLKTEITMRPSEQNLICFKNEFSILKNLSHPNIARILDFGLDEELMQYYFTSELVPGTDVYTATTSADIRTIVDLFVQALRALEYLHSFRIFHFDIKAANLLVTKENRMKLIDFGLASIDPKGKLMGTPSYMAPEIVRGESPDGRSDIYSLGVLWYYCLARKNPFRSGDPKVTIENQKTLIAPPPSKYNPKVPEYVDQIIKRMLEKRPDRRYREASQIIKELNILGGLDLEAETSETLLSYIPEKGRFIGRKKEIGEIKNIISGIRHEKSNYSIILISGRVGAGKKRLLDEVKYYAQMNDIPPTLADGHNITETRECLEKIDEHLMSEEGAKAFLIFDADRLEAAPAMLEQLKNTLSRVPVYSEHTPTLVAIGLNEQSSMVGELEPMVNLHIKLGNFSREALKEYIVNMTGLDTVPDFLLEEILKRTEGNPLFVTEIAKSLVTSGALFDSKGRWKESSFFDLGVDFKKIFPESLKDLLMESFLDLDPAEKKALELLSVAARPASSYELSVWTETQDIGGVIEKLLRKDILTREAAYEYYFRNALMAGYIYEDLPEKVKENYHDKIANNLIQAGESSDEIARHTGLGSDHRKAFEITSKTGDKYLKKGLGKLAIEYFNIAGRHKEVFSPEEAIELNMKLGEAHLISQDYKNALRYFNAAAGALTKIKEETANLNWQIDSLIKIGGTYIKLRELDKARQSFLTGKILLEHTGNGSAKRLILENFEGYLALQEGRVDEAENIYTKTRDLWKSLSQDEKLQITNNELGMVLLEKGELKRAIEILNQDLTYFKKIKDELLIARRHYNLAQAYQIAGDFDKSTYHFHEAAELSRETRDLELLLCIYNGLGNIYNITLELEKSREHYERARSLSHQLGDFKSHGAISINIGIIENKLGNTDLAYYEIYPALLYLKNSPQKSIFDWQILCRGEMEMAEILIKKGTLAEAEKTLSSAKDTARHIPEDETITFWLPWTEAHLYREKGQTDLFESAIKKLETAAKTADELEAIAGLKGHSEDDMEKNYRAILEINKLINSEESLPSVLKLILNHALELSGAESAAVVLRGPGGELNIAAHKNISDENWEADISHAFAKEAILSGALIESEDATADPRFSTEESVRNLNLKSVLCLPIHVKKQTIGALYLDNRSKMGAFKEIPKDIITTFTEQIGIAIDNAKRIEELSEKSKKMEGQLEEMGSQLKRYEEMMEESVHGFITQHRYEDIIGRSKAMSDILKTVDKIMDTEISVLLTGESGTGKELIAQALHVNSRRSPGNFVTINCGAIPATLMESELFGFKAGAFTGAIHDKKGLFEEAHGGTIFLDEVTDIDPALQVKLLRVIQEKELTRVGETKPQPCDVRIISATNKDIDRVLAEGKFREDLYWRICQIRLHLPPLKERREDIPLLTKHFLGKEPGAKGKKIAPHLLKTFMEYDWPGNIRELESLISVACALVEGETIDERCIPESYGIYKLIAKDSPLEAKTITPIKIDDKNYYRLGLSWKDYENIILAKAYQASAFRARHAARELGVAPTTMYNKIKSLDLDDRANPIYKDPFQYTPGHTLKSYTLPVFKAALTAAEGRPGKAISNLQISQGYFYKVMKKK